MKSSNSIVLSKKNTFINISNSLHGKIAIILSLICILSMPLHADDATTPEIKKDEKVKPTPIDNDTQTEPAKEVITGTSDRMERDQKNGITILIGNAKTVRKNEQDVEIGFLNADRITLKSDPETNETVEIIAEGNVEIRDQDMFATCEHATMNNLTNIIILKDNVIVTQDKDKLQTKLFTYNRTTGKQTGEGDVRFKVSITQATPIQEESSEDQKNDTDGDSTSDESNADKSEKDKDTSKDNTDKSTEQNSTTTGDTEEDSTENSEENQSDEEENTDQESNNNDDSDNNENSDD
ncbi:LPS export ABC transporter periplasmic protein LptC [Candidatus Poribacteria bacterium]|nr:LPS export ABC transporter periplasmic protein LptC [Candidatus Poribacteria bacterium]